MLPHVLRAKHCWYRDEGESALAHLDQVAGPGAFRIAGGDVAARTGLAFEGLLADLLEDDALLAIPAQTVIGRLWEAYPGRYAVAALDARGALDADWLRAAAAAGLLSVDPAEDGLVAKVVLAPVPEAIDRNELIAAIAAAGGAWERYVRASPDRTAGLLLDAAFFRARVMHRSMVLDRLDAIATAQPEAIDVAAGALAAWEPEEVARVGMRLHPGNAPCADALIAALRSRDFDALPARLRAASTR